MSLAGSPQGSNCRWGVGLTPPSLQQREMQVFLDTEQTWGTVSSHQELAAQMQGQRWAPCLVGVAVGGGQLGGATGWSQTRVREPRAEAGV